ncbi:6914_t:CDS:2, partial [Cetraspora pellucida]
HKNICVPEILKMLETEIDCNTLTTEGIYNSLFKNEYFNKLVKFDIDEINAIHNQIEKRKESLQKSCDINFLIDKFSTNNRFENFMDGGIYEKFFWNSKPFSENEKKIITNKWIENMERLIKLEKKTNMNQYIGRLLTIEEALKNNQLFIPDSSNLFLEDLKFEKEKRKDYLNDNGPIHLLINSTNISDKAKDDFNKRRLKILGQEEISTPEPSPEPSPDYSTEFNNLRNEIENINLSNILNLADGNDLYQKITNLNIPKEDIAKLQKLREDKLNELVEKQYNELNNIINNSRNIDDLSKIENELSNNNLLTNEQKNNLLSSIKSKKDEIKNESEFDSLQNLISEETDITKLESDLKTKINESSLNDEQKEKLEKLRLEKIEKLKPEKPIISFDELKEKIENVKISDPEEILDNGQILQDIVNSNLLPDDIEKLEKLRNDKLDNLRNEQYNQFNNLANTLEKEDELNNLNNEVINNILLPEDKKEIISKIIEDKLNEFKGKEKLEKENNENIGDCIDSNLLTDEFYNDIYRNIEELNDKYLSPEHTKLFLHQIREERRLVLEKEIDDEKEKEK